MIDQYASTVRRSVEVDAAVDRAFEVFVHMTSWWPREHRVVAADLDEVVIEPAVGGRCYQIGVDGSECDLGRVQTWDPPRRLQIAWHLDRRFEYEPDASRASEVDVTFTPVGEGRTRVELEHRAFDRHGPDGDAIRTAVGGEGGWGYILERYSACWSEVHAPDGSEV
jgi:uncharacterized protein YndB with AHSA1/START domain